MGRISSPINRPSTTQQPVDFLFLKFFGVKNQKCHCNHHPKEKHIPSVTARETARRPAVSIQFSHLLSFKGRTVYARSPSGFCVATFRERWVFSFRKKNRCFLNRRQMFWECKFLTRWIQGGPKDHNWLYKWETGVITLLMITAIPSRKT